MMNMPTIAVIGDTDCGKSTLIGQLLLETGSLPSQFVLRVKKLCQDRHIDFQPAYLVDYMRDEQAASSTLERTLAVLHLNNNKYTIIDTPGQIMLANKMVSGLSEADIVMIVLDVQEQNPKKYLFYFKLVSLLRIPHAVIVINKIDLIDYSLPCYKRFVERLQREIKISNKMTSIPASALQNVNLVKSSKNALRFGNRSIDQELTSIALNNTGSRSPSVFFMPVQSIVCVEKERVALGTVSEGSISTGERVTCASANKTYSLRVKKIFHDSIEVSTVSSGENAGLIFQASSRNVKRGDFLHNSKKPIKDLGYVDAWLYIVKSFLPDTQGLSVLYLTNKYPVKQIIIKRRYDYQLRRIHNIIQFAPHEFIQARIVFPARLFPFLKRYQRPDKMSVNNNDGIVAIGIIR